MAKTTVEIAKARFQRAKDAYGSLREQAIADTRFVLGDSENNWQWPGDVYDARSGISRKPCLTINITAQHCKQIENQIRQNRPSAKILPIDGQADVKTAEIYGGMLRSIQSYSNADTAHDIAAKHSIYGGEGFWRILTEYESESSFDQVISVKPLVNPQLVYIDPDAIEPDRSDAKWALVFEDIPRTEADDEYGDRDDEGNNNGLAWADDGAGGWSNKDTVRRAEYYWLDETDDELLQLIDGQVVLRSVYKDMPEKLGILNKRKTTRKQWKWTLLVGGKDTPQEEKDWPGAYMPIICVVGDETNVNGQIVRKGLVRDLKDSARMVNYSYSAAVETVALQTKTPWLASIEATEGYEDIWAKSNVENLGVLPYNAFNADGTPIPAPQRIQPAAMATAQVQMLQLSVEQARAASGQQNANFGIKSEAQSGVGIQRLKAQGEIATFNFPDNLARALKYEATVILDLIPKIYDRARVVRILGLDGTEKKVMLDPGFQGEARDLRNDPSGVDSIFNPTAGRYDVAIDTGPSYQTQRQEAADSLVELSSRAPALMQFAPDLIVKALDFQGAQEIADRLKKTLPPNLLEDNGDPEAQLAQAQGQVQQLTEQLQQAHDALGNAGDEVDSLEGQIKNNQAEAQAKFALQQQELEQKAALAEQQRRDSLIQAEQKRQDDIDQARLDAQVALEKAQIQADTSLQIEQMKLAMQLAPFEKEQQDIQSA